MSRPIIGTSIIGGIMAVCLGAFACNEPKASSGSTDATSKDAYELNSEKELVPPMDSAKHALPADSASAAGVVPGN